LGAGTPRRGNGEPGHRARSTVPDRDQRASRVGDRLECRERLSVQVDGQEDDVTLRRIERDREIAAGLLVKSPGVGADRWLMRVG